MLARMLLLEKGGESSQRISREIPFPAGIGEERAWEFAFWFFVLLSSRALGMREIPLKIVS